MCVCVCVCCYLHPAGQKVSGAGMGDNLAGLTYYATNDEDPYITLKNVVCEIITVSHSGTNLSML